MKRIKSELRFQSVSKKVLFFYLISNFALATEGQIQPYESLKNKANEIRATNLTTGWSYVISGGVALGVSIPGYYLSEDIFAKTIYSLGQTVGVGAVGYGAFLILVDDDLVRFEKILTAQTTLTESQKDALARSFVEETANQAKRTRHLRILTHGLMASLNLLNATTASHRELKTALFFLAGVNSLVAITSYFSISPEEQSSQQKLKAYLGPNGVNLAFRF